MSISAEALQRLRADPEVEYAVLDQRRYPHATNPNDPLFAGQWYLKSTEVSAVNAIDAWDHGQGSTGVVIAVLDTGVLYDHPDLGRGDNGGKLLPGFDFVSGTAQANDGDGRDADPSDPGDWINDTDKTNAAFTGCDVSGSSWHGTRVAGMIGALTNNAAGVAGLDWNSFLLPVRVLGKCGGIDSDILAGMRWAAGLHVDGVPDNPDPGTHPQHEPGRHRRLRAELPGRDPGADRAQGAGGDLGRQRRHGGFLARQLSRSRRALRRFATPAARWASATSDPR